MLSINRNQSPEETVKKIDRACLWREVECGKIGWGFSFPLNDYKLSDFAIMYCWNKIKSKLKLNFKIQINSASKQKQKQNKAEKKGHKKWKLNTERRKESRKGPDLDLGPWGKPTSPATERELPSGVRGVTFWGPGWFGMSGFFSCKLTENPTPGA